MLNLVNKQVPVSVVTFFERYYGVDVSGIEIEYKDMVDMSGYYSVCDTNRIYVANHIKGRGLATEMVIAHEINHVLQHKKNIGLTLNRDIMVSKFPNLAAFDDLIQIADIDKCQYELDYGVPQTDEEMDKMYKELDNSYWNQHLEIDSRLAEALYVYTEAGEEGFNVVIDHIFKCGVTGNLFERIEHMPDSMAKLLLLNEFKHREEELKANSVPLTEEDIDSWMEELLA